MNYFSFFSWSKRFSSNFIAASLMLSREVCCSPCSSRLFSFFVSFKLWCASAWKWISGCSSIISHGRTWSFFGRWLCVRRNLVLVVKINRNDAASNAILWIPPNRFSASYWNFFWSQGVNVITIRRRTKSMHGTESMQHSAALKCSYDLVVDMS